MNIISLSETFSVGSDVTDVINLMGEREIEFIEAAKKVGLTRIAIADKFTGGFTVRAALLIGHNDSFDNYVIYAEYSFPLKIWVRA